VQRRLVGFEHHPHAALADHLLHLVPAERAEEARPIGGAEEIQIGRLRRGRQDWSLDFVQSLQELDKGGVN